MKYTLAMVLALTSTLAVSAEKDVELDRAVRLQNLSLVAVINGDYNLACKAQTQVVDALSKSKRESCLITVFFQYSRILYPSQLFLLI